MVRFLGQNGLNVVTRMMGLILAVIGVHDRGDQGRVRDRRLTAALVDIARTARA